ncbi:hypothetical protein AB0H36_05100 [Kribbella sp. NPDC050820]|uniref:hypothetical protein n=1 Tax=Kribbella sp. NPDC050820 TaxID=3155408 RepID=UPI0033FC2D67
MTVQEPPEEPRTELVDKLLAGALSSLPVAGGAAGAWYEYVMEGPYSRRLAGWRARITEVVNELVLKVERLLDNEVFLDAFIQSTRIAQTTHQQEKLRALRNALVNSVALDAPDVDEQARFFRMVDDFSARHIVLLRWINDHESTTDQVDSGQRVTGSGVWAHRLPAFAGSGEMLALIVDDLQRSRLITFPDGFAELGVIGDTHFVGRASELGQRFLRFISEGDVQTTRPR